MPGIKAHSDSVAGFYKKPFWAIVLLTTLLFIIFRSHFEEYEGIFSAFVQGLYTEPCIKDWNVDVHFLLFGAYAYLNSFLPDIQVYGIVMALYNWVSLVLLGLVLYRILKINLADKTYFFWIILFLILSVDNIVNLSTNRIAFTFMAAAIGFAESCRVEGKAVSTGRYGLLFAVILFAGLLRSEIVILASAIYLLLNWLRKKRGSFFVYGSLALGITIWAFYNYVMIRFMTEARQIYYFKELDFIMRNNFNYQQLNGDLKMEVDAFFHYIMDKNHFTWSFYNSISVRGKEVGVMTHLYGFHVDAFLNTLQKSVMEYKRAWHYIFFNLFFGGSLIYYDKHRRLFWALHLLISTIFPVTICYYVVTPLRFLVPYYSVLGVFYVMMVLQAIGKPLWARLALTGILLLVIYNSYSRMKLYNEREETIHTSVTKLAGLRKGQPPGLPIVINNFNAEKFFPSDPYIRFQKQQVVFEHLYYFMAYDCFIDRWKKLCDCDPLSVKDKIDYTVAHHNLFIIADDKLKYLQDYFRDKYHVNLQAKKLKPFDNELNVYQLFYGP